MGLSNALLRWRSPAAIGGAPSSAGMEHGSPAHARYRPDIDGLRAIAVLPVVLFHLNISLFSGGFVGVDVFFVISGYLITSLIHAEMAAGTYSVANFYVRRARRIFPALFVMCAATSVLVLLFCLPSDARLFRDSLAAATLFASNIYFYVTADYFAAAAETQPLLHTWSLAVEEQFYIVFPLVLWLARRHAAAGMKPLLVALTLLSLAASIWLVEADPPGAFYLLHSRAWELLLGALLAVGAVPAVRSRAWASALGLIGLALIGGSVALYWEHTPFPGVAALAPCIGAALIIHVGRDSSLPVVRLLSMPLLRFVGLISYSLYLWHWPAMVIGRYVAYWHGWDPELKLHKLAVLAASFLCAVLSWRFVEKPFRQKPYRLGRAAILSASAVSMVALVLVAGLFHPLSQGYWNMPREAERALAALDLRSIHRQRACFLTPENDGFRYFDQAACLALSGTRQNWLLIGDSQAADLWSGLAGANPEVNLMQATASGCRPLLGATGEERCTDLMRFLFDDFIPQHSFDVILMSARWSPGNVEQVRETAQRLKPHARRVVVVGPHVEYQKDLPWLLAASLLKRDPSIVDRFRIAKQKETDRLFAARLRPDGIGYISLYAAICSGGRCRVTDSDGLPLAFDYGHLTPAGSTLVAREIRKSGAL